MTQWEYKREAVDSNHAMDITLKDRGIEGWELVTASCYLDSRYTTLIFKRPIPPPMTRTTCLRCGETLTAMGTCELCERIARRNENH